MDPIRRMLDNEPCPVCGGDRLRPDYTRSGRCHARRAGVLPPWLVPTDDGYSIKDRD